MPKYYFDNICLSPKNCERKPWKNPGPSFRERPYINRAVSPAEKTKATFVAPSGINSTESKYRGYVSFFREVSVPKMQARIVEYYQYVMQPVGIFLVMPENVMTSLEEYGLVKLRSELPGIINKMNEKHMQVKLPSSIFKLLEKAKISADHHLRLNERIRSLVEVGRSPIPENVPKSDCGINFEPRGPFVIVMYDMAKRLVLCLARVYKLNQDLGILGTTIKKTKRRDEKLIDILLESNALEEENPDEVLMSHYDMEEVNTEEDSEVEEMMPEVESNDRVASRTLEAIIKSAGRNELNDRDSGLDITQGKQLQKTVCEEIYTDNEFVVSALETGEDQDFTDDESLVTVIEHGKSKTDVGEVCELGDIEPHTSQVEGIDDNHGEREEESNNEEYFDMESPVCSVKHVQDKAVLKVVVESEDEEIEEDEVEENAEEGVVQEEVVEDREELDDESSELSEELGGSEKEEESQEVETKNQDGGDKDQAGVHVSKVAIVEGLQNDNELFYTDFHPMIVAMVASHSSSELKNNSKLTDIQSNEDGTEPELQGDDLQTESENQNLEDEDQNNLPRTVTPKQTAVPDFPALPYSGVKIEDEKSEDEKSLLQDDSRRIEIETEEEHLQQAVVPKLSELPPRETDSVRLDTNRSIANEIGQLATLSKTVQVPQDLQGDQKLINKSGDRVSNAQVNSLPKGVAESTRMLSDIVPVSSQKKVPDVPKPHKETDNAPINVSNSLVIPRAPLHKPLDENRVPGSLRAAPTKLAISTKAAAAKPSKVALPKIAISAKQSSSPKASKPAIATKAAPAKSPSSLKVASPKTATSTTNSPATLPRSPKIGSPKPGISKNTSLAKDPYSMKPVSPRLAARQNRFKMPFEIMPNLNLNGAQILRPSLNTARRPAPPESSPQKPRGALPSASVPPKTAPQLAPKNKLPANPAPSSTVGSSAASRRAHLSSPKTLSKPASKITTNLNPKTPAPIRAVPKRALKGILKMKKPLDSAATKLSPS